ncbi:MAG: VWA domain-containing protein, partial [Candidatus Thorarchaeota archaeon]
MKGKIAILLALIFVLSFTVISPIQIVPNRPLTYDYKNNDNDAPTMQECMMELNRITVSGNIIDNYASVSYELVFDNTASEKATQVYWFFGLQEGVRLSNVSVILGSVTYWGRIMREKTAVEGYHESVEAGRTAVLVTRSSGGYYVSFNIENRTLAVLSVFVEGLLTREVGLYNLALPISLENKFRTEFVLDLSIRSSFAPVIGYSMLGISGFTVDDLADGVRLRYYAAETEVLPNLALTYALGRQTGGSQLFTYTNGTDNFFVYLLAPSITEISERAPRQYVFVIDESGSMSGSKMDHAKTAFSSMIADLSEPDIFNIIAFDTVITMLWEEPYVASAASVAEAQSWVNGLTPGGSTNFHDASLAGLGTFTEGENAKAMLILSDGQPTSGPITTTNELLTAIGNANALDVSISTAAFGSDADENLMANLAAQNNGFFAFIQTDAEAAGTLIDFYEFFATPVASEYTIDFNGAIEVVSLMPLENTPFFNGTEVTISGRYGASLSVDTSIHYSDGIQTYLNSAGAADDDKQHIEYIWAQQMISQLLKSIELEGATVPLREAITNIALQYGIVVGGYTALLVTAYDVDSEAEEDDSTEEPATSTATTTGEIIPPYAADTTTGTCTTPAPPPPAADPILPLMAPFGL